MVKSHTEAISNNFSVNFIIFCMRFCLYQCLLVETKKSITTWYEISDKLSSPSIKLYLWNVKSFPRRKFCCELIPVSKIQIESVVPELSSTTFHAQSNWAWKVEPPFTTQTPTQPRATRGGVSSYHFLWWKSYDWTTLMSNKTITTTLVSSFTFSVESSDGDREQVVGLDQQNKPPQMH